MLKHDRNLQHAEDNSTFLVAKELRLLNMLKRIYHARAHSSSQNCDDTELKNFMDLGLIGVIK